MHSILFNKHFIFAFESNGFNASNRLGKRISNASSSCRVEERKKLIRITFIHLDLFAG